MAEVDILLHSGRADDCEDIRPRRRRARLIASLAILLVIAVIGTYLGVVLTAPLPFAQVTVCDQMSPSPPPRPSCDRRKVRA